MRSVLLLIAVTFYTGIVAAQGVNKYEVNLQEVINDRVKVTYTFPGTDQKEIHFYFPKIIPGTYNISDYGKFIHDLKAFDQKGRELSVEKLTENEYLIQKASKLDRITYYVEDTYDTQLENEVYPMAGTNIEEGKNFVIGTPGFFGYTENTREIPYEVTILKPAGFYGSTALEALERTSESDTYRVTDYDRLVDSPMMYNVPDTAVMTMGGAEVLVSVYSPNKRVTADFLSKELETLLENQRRYLGGELPVDTYAFIYYFAEGPGINPMAGALEHSYSSFYYLPELPQEQLAPSLVDITAHEFFHIVTPLTIHSEEIENFDFNEADLSMHLWLYEGVTEYFAGHVQVRYGMITEEEYLDKLAAKIADSRTNYQDDLPFTELSEKAAGEYEAEYGNVYQKGALIGAMLDIRLLELSGGSYDLEDLLSELGDVYGKNRAFEDGELFDQIERMTYPEIGDFFEKYVSGGNPLPLKEYFAKAGIEYIESDTTSQVSLGNIQLGYDNEQAKFVVADVSQMNDFGKRLGYRQGDLLVAVQGNKLGPENVEQVITSLRNELQEGDTLAITIQRPKEDGSFEEMTLAEPVVMEKGIMNHVLRFMEAPDFQQLDLRNNWLMAEPATARPEDVESIDGIINAVYGVISGPAGERDWKRYRSLFTRNATLNAVAVTSEGDSKYVALTPGEYEQQNASFFMENDFREEELGREVWQFGNIAQVKSGYQYTIGDSAEPQQRGVNVISLVYDEGRWWVTSILWTSETEENQIPTELQK